MADYVEKFKASDPFNMAEFNAKIDQINTAVGGGVTAANEAKTAASEAKTAATNAQSTASQAQSTANSALSVAQSAGKIKLLWSNSNLTSFNDKTTVELDLTGVKFLIITATATGATDRTSTIIEYVVGQSGQIVSDNLQPSGVVRYGRRFIMREGAIYFQYGVLIRNDGTGASNPVYCIPTSIYGIY